MEQLAHQIGELLDNPAFFVFLGTCVTAFFTYKAAVLPMLEQRRKQKVTDGDGRVDPKKATSFDELKAVVEILQGELDRKDKAHQNELLRTYTRIESLEKSNDKLTGENVHLFEEVERLKVRLHKAHINNE